MTKKPKPRFRVGQVVFHAGMGEYVRIIKDHGPHVMVFYTRCGENHFEPQRYLRLLTRREKGGKG